MAGLDEIQINGGPFFVKREVIRPVREQDSTHQCVCHLTERQVVKGVLRTLSDKCHAKVENPDQPFCDDCEANEHHLLPQRPRGVASLGKTSQGQAG